MDDKKQLFHQIHIKLPMGLFFQWKQNKDIQNINTRIVELVQIDTDLKPIPEQKRILELQKNKDKFLKQKRLIDDSLLKINIELSHIKVGKSIKDNKESEDRLEKARQKGRMMKANLDLIGDEVMN